jgi:aminopeptidase N
LAVPGCGTVVVNSGQTGYYRTLYAPALLERLTGSFAQLKPIDQIGLLADNWGLGLAGYQSAAEALDLVDAVPATANPQVWTRVSTILANVHAMYEGDPRHQQMLARYASSKLSPVLQRVGWSARANEAANIAVLRSELIGTLGHFGDRAVVAEANRRFAANDPSVTAGPLRTTILAIVAQNADAATWDRIPRPGPRGDEPARQGAALPAARLHAGRGARPARLAAGAHRRGGCDDQPGHHLRRRRRESRPCLCLRTPEPGESGAARRRVLTQPLFPGPRRGLIGSGHGRQARGLCEPLSHRAVAAPADQAIASIQDRIRVRQTRLPDITRWLEARKL